jgi:hypothetical protein
VNKSSIEKDMMRVIGINAGRLIYEQQTKRKRKKHFIRDVLYIQANLPWQNRNDRHIINR